MMNMMTDALNFSWEAPYMNIDTAAVWKLHVFQ